MAPAVTCKANFLDLTVQGGGFRGNRKTRQGPGINFSAFWGVVCVQFRGKLLAMSSFLVNSNYVDPKFPPCEEYCQTDYLPSSHSPDLYSGQRRDAGSRFPQQPIEAPFRPACPEQRYSSCLGSRQPPAPALLSTRGRGPLCEPGTPSPPSPLPPSCSQTPLLHPSPPGKEPVVYAWMKKVHVTTRK